MYAFVRGVVLSTKLIILPCDDRLVDLLWLWFLNATASENASIEVMVVHLALNLYHLFVDICC